MKHIVIVPDGMWDEPIVELGNKTPLEVARKTNMDYMAQHGMTGLVKTIPDKMAPGSDVGNMSLLGYDPAKNMCGRAALEAASMGLELKEDEVAFRCNLVTVADGKMVDYSAGHISTKEAGVLIKDLEKAINLDDAKFYVGKSYRHIIVLKVRDPQTFLKIQTTPPHDILGKEYKNFLPKGKEAEKLLSLMERSRSILENHSINQVRFDLKENAANMIWLWGQGTKPILPSFEEKYGVKGSIISAVDLVNGIGKLIGLNVIKVPGITGYYDTNFAGKGEYALKSLKENDFVFIHVEAPDEAGHNGDIQAKVTAIENIDREIIGQVLNYFSKHSDVRILVVPDHPTPIKYRTHTNSPVGFIMYGKNIEHDGSQEFSEQSVNKKEVQFQNGEEMMSYFLKKFL